MNTRRPCVVVVTAALVFVPLSLRVPPFVAAQQERLRTVLIADVTASLDAAQGRSRASLDAIAAVEQWLSSSEPMTGEWMLGRVDRQPQLGATFSADRETLRSSARTLFDVSDDQRFGPSPVWDAIDLAIDALSRQAEPARGSVIVVTDGRVSGNRAGVAEVIAHARAARVVVHVLSRARDDVFDVGGNTALLVQPRLALEQLAKGTGGRYVPRDEAPLSAHLRQLVTSPAR